MKTFVRKSLVLFSLPLLTRCAYFTKERKQKINPMEERISALEIDLKEQAREISRLNSTIQQLKKTKTPEKDELTLGALIQPKQELEEKKILPTTKLKPEENDEVPSVSPLMAEAETIADSSHEPLQNYYRGVQLRNDKKYEDAIDSFRSFIHQNPKHVYADRAQFLIIDSHFRNKDFGMVVVSTNLLETQYPYSLKIPEALYRRGLAYLEMNQNAQAKLTFAQLIKDFPKTPIALIARKKWSDMGTESQTQIH